MKLFFTYAVSGMGLLVSAFIGAGVKVYFLKRPLKKELKYLGKLSKKEQK